MYYTDLATDSTVKINKYETKWKVNSWLAIQRKCCQQNEACGATTDSKIHFYECQVTSVKKDITFVYPATNAVLFRAVFWVVLPCKMIEGLQLGPFKG
jgi:hypothetical protein